MPRRYYTAQSRNGYTAVDEYLERDGKPDMMVRLVEVFPTRKLAESVAAALNEARRMALVDARNSRYHDSMEAQR